MTHVQTEALIDLRERVGSYTILGSLGMSHISLLLSFVNDDLNDTGFFGGIIEAQFKWGAFIYIKVTYSYWSSKF